VGGDLFWYSVVQAVVCLSRMWILGYMGDAY